MGCCYTCNLYNTECREQLALYGNNPNWMEIYAKKLKDKKIINLIVPGTHDSGTYRVFNVIKDVAKCQNFSIKRQLELGIRYLDIRYSAKSKKKRWCMDLSWPKSEYKIRKWFTRSCLFFKI